MNICTEELKGTDKKYLATLRAMNSYLHGYRITRGGLPPKITVSNAQFESIVSRWLGSPGGTAEKLKREALAITHKGVLVHPSEPSKLPYHLANQ